MKKSKKDKDFVHKAYYKGGTEALRAFISKEMQYPEEAKKHNIQGTVKLAFEVNYKGAVHHVKVISSVGYGCDEEAVRLATLLKYEVPKTYKLRIGFKKKLNIHFKYKKVQKEIPSQPKKQIVNTYSYTITQNKPSVSKPKQATYHYTIDMKEK